MNEFLVDGLSLCCIVSEHLKRVNRIPLALYVPDCINLVVCLTRKGSRSLSVRYVVEYTNTPLCFRPTMQWRFQEFMFACDRK